MKYTSLIYAKEILDIIPGKRIIIRSRDKNIEFLKEYSLKNDNIVDIVNSLNENHFKERRINCDSSIKSRYLYVFKPLLKITNYNGDSLDYVYIKICEIDDNILVVSIHKDDI